MSASRGNHEGLAVRELALRILLRVETEEAFAAPLLDSMERSLHDSRDRRLLHGIVLGVLRRRSILDHVLGKAASRPIDRMDPSVLEALRIGTHGLLYLDRVPDFAVVNLSAELIRRFGRSSAVGFVNGVLRRIARDRDSLLPPSAESPDVDGLALAGSHPPWWTKRLVARLGWDDAERLLQADNRPVPTVLRINPRRASSEQVRDRLARDGIRTEPSPFVPGALRVVEGVPQRTEGFAAGWFTIQDEASQIVPGLLGADFAGTVVDACAAPGGKSDQIAGMRAVNRVIAIDRHASRMRRLKENVDRLGTPGLVAVVADMEVFPPIRPGSAAGVLVDAPCSGTGTLRRHPEIRWRLREADLGPLADRQFRILSGAADLVENGGRLVYSVCSMEPEEGEGVVRRFLRDRPEFRLLDPRPFLPEPCRPFVESDLALRTSPSRGGLDGFFAVAMAR